MRCAHPIPNISQALRWEVTGDKCGNSIRLSGVKRALAPVLATDVGVKEGWDRQFQMGEHACTTCGDCRAVRIVRSAEKLGI